MPARIIDNSTEAYQLKGILQHFLASNEYSEIAIATGYWDLAGMVGIQFELRQFLQRKGTRLRLLLGEEPTIRAYQVKNPESVDPNFPRKYFKKDMEDLDLKPEFQQVVDMMSRQIEAGSLQVKVYKKTFLHAKCYIFGSEDENAVGVIGSSNFTYNGLVGNLELNQVEDNNATVNYQRKNLIQHPSHRSWFEALWNEAEDWSGQFKEEILDLSKHGSLCFSPYEMYIHALYRVYGWELDDEKEGKVSEEREENRPRLLKFQVENANRLIQKLDRQGVAMLADSVGLGKTYTAIKVAEYYKQQNDRVVVICPAGLIPQWRQSFGDLGILPTELYSMQDIEQIRNVKDTLRTIPVGLFVFDESHNLRGSGGQRFEEFIKWRQQNLNARTLLVTATPINNQLTDLTNQIILASGGEVHRLGKFFDRERQKYFTIQERLDLLRADINKQIRENGFVDWPALKEQLTPLLNKFLVRRTRQGIQAQYPDGLEINGQIQKFPETLPLNLEYLVQNEYRNELLHIASEMPELVKAYNCTAEGLAELEYLAHPLDALGHLEQRASPIQSSLELVYSGLLALGFPCYRYNIYRHAYYGQLKEDLTLSKEQNKDLSRQIGIYGIFRTILLKRLESSWHAISKSLDNYKRKLESFDEKLKTLGKIISVKDMSKVDDLIKLYNEESSEEDALDFDMSKLDAEEITYLDADPGAFDLERLKEDIQKDLKLIAVLQKQIGLLKKKDNKLQVLANKLDEFEGRKVLIFTYFTDTLTYLRDALPTVLRNKRNVEFALGNKNDIENFAGRFSPVAKKHQLKPSEKEIDFLVATDKLSEGQNLQDCGIIINYDLHWNPVRMIQRNGRVNRLGTKHAEIFIYNFRPTEQLESYLKLVQNLKSKIDLIRYTIGSDQSVLDEMPMPQDFTEDLYSRDEKKRLEAFKKIFETSELLAADDLFLDDLRAFERSEEFTSDYKQSIRNMPKGKWGHFAREQKASDNFSHLAHIIGEEDDFGIQESVFATFGTAGAQIVSSADGLLYVQTGSENNKRFKDNFVKKAETEATVRDFINLFEFAGDVPVLHSDAQLEAMAAVTNTMIEYGYPVGDIEHLNSLFLRSENAYWKKEVYKRLRRIRTVLRNGEVLTSELIDDLVNLAKQFPLAEAKPKRPLSEAVQIFTR